MKLVADESVDRQIIQRLRQDGHEVVYIAEIEPGISDEKVLEIANDTAAVLLTADKDFGELIYRQKLVSAGVLLLRLAGLPPLEKAETVSLAIDQHHSELLSSFAVISSRAIRIRRQSS
ncbi:MAG: DUF5615 family PIN-like protein [Chloroflexi bacterium]|nr:DUF5615 family PIN-like protein [Chloroflexota bacterium]